MALVLKNANVLGVERIHGVNRRTGEVYDFKVVHVLDGFKSRELRVPDDYKGALPSAGAADLEVRPSVITPDGGGRGFLRLEFVAVYVDGVATSGDAARAA